VEARIARNTLSDFVDVHAANAGDRFEHLDDLAELDGAGHLNQKLDGNARFLSSPIRRS